MQIAMIHHRYMLLFVVTIASFVYWINMFVNECLKQDGVFALRMIGLHAGIVFNSELVMRLYRAYSQILDDASSGVSTESGNTRRRRRMNNQLLMDGGLLELHNKKSSTSGSGGGSQQSLMNKQNPKNERKRTTINDDDDDGTLMITALIPASQTPGNEKTSPNSSGHSTVVCGYDAQ
jgi:hypothetical protein